MSNETYQGDFRYRPDIDGLRALAVLIVVGFHAEIGAFRGGFIGVDVFFVISGYLITGIILRSLDIDRFSFVEFYVRRINRIFPALGLVLAFVALAGWVVLYPPEFSNLGKQLLGGAGFVSNFVMWSDTGYFVSQDKPLLHLWSLAVEEQFYLVWPLFLFAVSRTRVRPLIPIAVCVFLSFTVNIWLVSRSQAAAAFYLPFGRFWEILIGGLLIAFERRYGAGTRLIAAKYLDAFSVAGLGLLVAALLTVDRNTLWPGWLACLPVAGSVLLIFSGSDALVNRVILSQRAVVWIGLISYPLYLWHWPLFVFARIVNGEQVPRAGRVAIVVISFLLAALTYRIVERPIRFGARKRRSALVLSGAMATFAIVALPIYTESTAPRLGRAYNTVVARDKADEPPGGFFDKTGNPAGTVVPGDSLRKIVFLGDSHGVQYRPRFEELAVRRAGIPSVIFMTYGGCPPFPGVNRRGTSWDGMVFRCPQYLQKAVERALQPDVSAVVFSAYWEGYFREFEIFDVADPKKTTIAFPTPASEVILRRFENELKQFIDAGKRVYLILPNPDAQGLNPSSLMPPRLPLQSAKASYHGVPITEAVMPTSRLGAELKSLALRQHVTVIDPVFFLCSNDSCPTIGPDGRSIYVDNHHLRPSFVRNYASFIDQVASY